MLDKHIIILMHIQEIAASLQNNCTQKNANGTTVSNYHRTESMTEISAAVWIL